MLLLCRCKIDNLLLRNPIAMVYFGGWRFLKDFWKVRVKAKSLILILCKGAW